MQSGYRFILNSLLVLIAFFAIGLFIFQDPIFESKSVSNDIANIEAWTKSLKVTPDIGASEATLKNEALAGLKNYVVNFDFNRVCWRPGSPACAPGNNLPFLVKKDEPAVPAAPVEE